MLDRELERSRRESREVRERRSVPCAPARSSRHRLELARRTDVEDQRAGPVERRLCPSPVRWCREGEAAAAARHCDRGGSPCVPCASANEERSAECRLVEQAQRRRGATELDRTGDDRTEQLVARPELAPPHVRESPGELLVAIVLPVSKG